MGKPSERNDVVYVPRQPAPIIRPDDKPDQPDEIDEVLDDLFGHDDDHGPTKTDAVLVAVGVAAVGAGQLADLPGVFTVLGVALIGLGAILPLRSTARRLAERRERSRIDSTIGDGVPLRQDDAALRQLADLYGRVHDASAPLAPHRRSHVIAVAHALVDEVATLLAGELPASAAEAEYVRARVDALAELGATIEDARIGDGDPVKQQARTEARLEVEEISGRSALRESQELLNELRPDTDG